MIIGDVDMGEYLVRKNVVMTFTTMEFTELSYK